MSNLNQKGPMEEGSMTGRRMGRCTNFGATRTNKKREEAQNIDKTNAVDPQYSGFGRGRGCGMGRGIRNRFGGNRRGEGMNQNRQGSGMRRGGGKGRGMGGRFADDI